MAKVAPHPMELRPLDHLLEHRLHWIRRPDGELVVWSWHQNTAGGMDGWSTDAGILVDADILARQGYLYHAPALPPEMRARAVPQVRVVATCGHEVAFRELVDVRFRGRWCDADGVHHTVFCGSYCTACADKSAAAPDIIIDKPGGQLWLDANLDGPETPETIALHARIRDLVLQEAALICDEHLDEVATRNREVRSALSACAAAIRSA